MNMYLINESTLTNIATAIKTKLGKTDTEKILVENFAELIESISAASTYDSVFNIINTASKRNTTSMSFNGVITAITCNGEELFGAGTDNENNLLKLYGKLGNGSIVCNTQQMKDSSGNSFNVCVTGIEYDAEKEAIHIASNSGSYKIVSTLYENFINVDNPIGSGVSIGTDATNAITQIEKGTHIWVFGERNSGSMFGYRSSSYNTFNLYNSSSVNILVDGCSFNDLPIAISNQLVYYFASTTGTSRKAVFQPEQTDSSIELVKCKQMNNYFCVTGVNDSQTYLYYTTTIVDGTTASSNTTSVIRKKIANEKLDIIGMAYIKGIYTVIGVNSSGEAKVWQSTDLATDNNVYLPLSLEDGFTATAMTSDDTYIYIASTNQDNTQTNITKIDMTN